MKHLTRRDFLRTAVCGAAASILLPRSLMAQTTTSAPSTGPVRKPNVLFIIVDDLRPQLGCYGDKLAITPNIDKLSRSGTLFKHAYVQQAVCSPSRTSLLTGCRPDTTKVYDLVTHFRKTIPNVLTLPQAFKQAGYHTQSLSKVYHGSLDDKESWSVESWKPKTHQWASKENIDLITALEVDAKEKNLTGDAYARAVRGPAYEMADLPDEAYHDGMTAAQAVKALNEVKDKPFFLAVGFLKPHLPFVAPKKYWDLYKKDDIKLPDNMSLPENCPDLAPTTWGELRSYHGIPQEGPLDKELARTLIHAYYASASYADAQIGKVLDELDRLKLSDNTIVVLVGDHGWKLGEHGLWSKHTNFELDTNAPMIIKAPGQKAAGKESPALTEFVDIYPTLCELAGVPLPKHLEGASFAPLLNDPNKKWKTAAFSQFPRSKVMGYSMRTDRYRFTLWQSADGTVNATELYDHKSDEKENVNIAGKPENAELVKQLTEQLRKGWKGALPS